MLTIEEFIAARLNDDEQAATQCQERDWQFSGSNCHVLAERSANGSFRTIAWCANGYDDDLSNSIHIANYDPGRVLREVEAKRALVADLEAQKHFLNQYQWYGCDAMTDDPSGNPDLPDVPTGRPCTCGRDEDVKRRLGLLSSVWSDHPDYRSEWGSVSTLEDR